MTAISATEARSNFSELIGRVAYGKERLTIERRGRPLAVLLPIEDLAHLEAGAGEGPAGANDILSTVADNIPGTIYQWIRHPDGREEYSYVSPGTREIFGVESEAVFSDPATLDRAVHPEDREFRTRAISDCTRVLKAYDVQYRVRTPAGETKWLHAVARPERRADGATAWNGLTLDITKWKEIEAALRESEARYRWLYDSIPVSVWEEDWSEVKKMIDGLAARGVSDWQAYFDSHGDAVKRAYDLCDTMSINTTTLQMFRTPTADSAREMVSSENMPAASLQTFANWLATFAVGDQTFVIEAEETRDDGTTFAARTRSFIPPDHADTWARVITTVEDISDRKQAEEALRESEARLRDLIDGSIEGILIHRDHKPLLVNEAWAAIHGYTVEEVLGLDSLVDLISPADRERLIGYRDARVHGEDAPLRYEYRALRKDGSEIWLEHLVRVVDWEGAPAVQTVVIDITERKSAEAALERARDELERRVEERTRELHATNRALEEEIGTRKEVEERLRESERDLLNLIEGSVQGVLIVTKGRAPRFANQAFAGIFGYDSPAELLALDNTLGLLAPHEVARLDALRKPLLAGVEAPISYEFDGIRKDGTTIRLQCMARTMAWRGERVIQVTLYDITERKLAEKALRESEERFRLLTEIAPVGIFETDAKGDSTFVNDTWCELAGLTPEQAKGPGWVAALHPEDRDRVSAEWYAASANDQMFRAEYRFRRPNGEVSWLFGQGLNVTDAAGHTTGFVGTVTDITERKHAEQALQESEARLSSFINNIPNSIYLKDMEGRYVLVNDSAVKQYGFPKNRLIGKTVYDIHPKGEADATVKQDREVLKQGVPIEAERELTFPDGSKHNIIAVKFPIRGESGEIIGIGGINIDITERKNAERALRESEERLRQATQLARIGYYVWDAVEDRCTFCSEELASIHGLTPEQYITRASEVDGEFALTHPDDRAAVRKAMKALRNGEKVETEYRVLTPQGDARHIREIAQPVFDETGRVVQEIGACLDISEMKRAETLLARAMDVSPSVFALFDAEDHLVICNQKYRDLYETEGLPIVPGVAFEAVVHAFAAKVGIGDTKKEAEAWLAQRVNRRAHPARGIEYRRGDGEWIEVSDHLLDDGSIFTVGLIITERRKAEETIRTRDAWLRAILDNAPIEIVLKDTEGRIMAISRNVGEKLGLPMGGFTGRTTADFLPQQIAEVYMAMDRKVVETGRVIQQEVAEDWDGTTRHFLSSKFPLRDDDGQIVGVCSLTSDITEAKLAEERLRQAQKMEAVGQLTGGVAHDFNNLLAVIAGNAELLGNRLGPDDRQVAAVLRATGRGAELTQRLLAFSRRQPLKPQAVDLAGRVAGMTELLTRTLGATIEISVSSTPGLWQASADPGQLENALLNLAINARDAMPEGGRLSISSANASLEAGEIATLLAGQAPEAALETAREPGDYVVLSVSDTGAGMSPAVLARVFEPFFTTKDVGQGSGLGLSMVYGFARQSGGFAAIESAPGRGTTVRLYLPRAAAAAPAPGASAPGARDRADQLPRGHGETVLLIEDTRDVRELTIVLLEDLDYRVLAAADAAEAGALLAENPDVALLLTDVILPGERSGPDFAETARRHNPALKVLFMSGYPAKTLMPRAGSPGRDTPLLPKPFRKAALAKAVRDALDDREEIPTTE